MAKNGRKDHRRSNEKRREGNDKAGNNSSGSKGLSQPYFDPRNPDERAKEIAKNPVPVNGPEKRLAEDLGGNGTDAPMSKADGEHPHGKEAAQPGPDHHDCTVGGHPESELQYYKVELEAEQLEIRRLRKIEQDFQRLQAKELQAIDRFQGKFDSDFVQALGVINKRMQTLIFFLYKCACHLEGHLLSDKLKLYAWLSPYDRKEDKLDVSNRVLRKKLLESMVWKFLQHQLFSRPFLCFGDKLGELADELFSTLYDQFDEHPESVKWRTFTVERLEALNPNGGNEETHKRLLGELQRVLKDLEYEVEDADLRTKSESLFTEAIKLAKDFAAQRAIYQFFEPGKAEESWTQCLKSEYCKNKKDEDDEGPDEGKIAFIVVPALLRYGTVMGEGLKEQPILLSKAFVHLD